MFHNMESNDMIMLGPEHYAYWVNLVENFPSRVIPKLKTLWPTKANI